eukprot:gene10128-11013_t
MDWTPHSYNAASDRAINNAFAWKNRTGYRTTSGCACWDRSMNPCIPKRLGWGYNFNFWCLFCCFVCEDVDATVVPEGTQSRRLSARHSISIPSQQRSRQTLMKVMPQTQSEKTESLRYPAKPSLDDMTN